MTLLAPQSNRSTPPSRSFADKVRFADSDRNHYRNTAQLQLLTLHVREKDLPKGRRDEYAS